jgi:hypothetical protein
MRSAEEIVVEIFLSEMDPTIVRVLRGGAVRDGQRLKSSGCAFPRLSSVVLNIMRDQPVAELW